MALKTTVKVGNISNLSDARYCSGMGVELLGFSVIPGTPNFITPELFQDIRGWISGPKVVAEIKGEFNQEILNKIVSDYAPDFIEISREHISKLPPSPLPLIVRINGNSTIGLPEAAYLLTTLKDLKSIEGHVDPGKLLIEIESMDQLEIVLTNYQGSGVSLQGSHEIRPGFKEYGELSEVLERLDE